MRHHIVPMLNGFGRMGKYCFVPCTVIDTTPINSLVTIDDGSRDMWQCLLPPKDFRSFCALTNKSINVNRIKHYGKKEQGILAPIKARDK